MAAPSTKDVPKNYSVINVVRRLFSLSTVVLVHQDTAERWLMVPTPLTKKSN